MAEKEGVLLCLRTLGDKGSDDQKTRYKAKREARYGKLKEDWRQMEIVLTPHSLSMYTRPVSQSSMSLSIIFFYISALSNTWIS